MDKLVIIGGGKATNVIRHIIFSNQNPKIEITGYTDIEKPNFEHRLNYLGTDERIFDFMEGHKFIISIGTPKVRKLIYDRFFSKKSHLLVNIIHPTVYVSSEVSVGKGNVIGASTTLFCNAKLGNNCWVGINTCIGHDCLIGDHCVISSGVSFAGSINIGNGTLIGAGASIAPDISIGDNCLISAGATVLKDIPNNCTVVANPGRVVRKQDKGESG